MSNDRTEAMEPAGVLRIGRDLFDIIEETSGGVTRFHVEGMKLAHFDEALRKAIKDECIVFSLEGTVTGMYISGFGVRMTEGGRVFEGAIDVPSKRIIARFSEIDGKVYVEKTVLRS